MSNSITTQKSNLTKPTTNIPKPTFSTPKTSTQSISRPGVSVRSVPVRGR